ncbi:MAG: SDR family oxidoreductase [Clostridia bacterium]|nr:SDR family oxidoreductase [Clostridia bacterium]
MDKKVAIITGSRRGLGEAAAYRLARQNYDIVVNDRVGKEEVDKVVENLQEKYHVNAIGVMADVSKEEEVQKLLSVVKERFNKIDLLINNAAIVEDMEIADRKTELFNETIINNITSTYLMSKYIGKEMFDHKGGKIINISSTNGINSFFPTSIDYDASKAAIISLTHNFALEYAPYVMVNSIAPGWINTDMNKQLPKKLIAEENEKIYLKRFAEPFEIANFICFLASDECSYLNGEVIKLDGGY